MLKRVLENDPSSSVSRHTNVGVLAYIKSREGRLQTKLCMRQLLTKTALSPSSSEDY